MKIFCFHNPDEENGYMSNWYLSDFAVGGVRLSSLEQYMMYKKALRFGDEETSKQILATDDAAYIKKLGRAVRGYDNHYWNGVRQIIVYEGLCAKFSQNEELKSMLKATGTALLAECAVKDTIWGIGLSMTDPDKAYPFKMERAKPDGLHTYDGSRKNLEFRAAKHIRQLRYRDRHIRA